MNLRVRRVTAESAMFATMSPEWRLSMVVEVAVVKVFRKVRSVTRIRSYASV